MNLNYTIKYFKLRPLDAMFTMYVSLIDKKGEVYYSKILCLNQ